jgi:hypothetical protein
MIPHRSIRTGGALAACLFATTLTTGAHAQAQPGSDAAAYAQLQQTLPSSGDAQIVFFNVNAFGGVTGQPTLYHVDNPSVELANLTQVQVTQVTGRNPGNAFAMVADTNVTGALLRMQYQNFGAVGPIAGVSGGASMRFVLFCKSTLDNQPPRPSPAGFASSSSDFYGVTFNALNYNQAYNAYQSYLHGTGSPTGYTGKARPTSDEFRQSVYECGVPGNPDNPLVGSFGSLQSQMIDGGLNLADPVPATDPQLALDTSEWGAGLRVGRVETGDRSGVQVDGIVNKSWRIAGGNRTLVTLEVPFSYRDLSGQRQFRIHGALSLTLPLRKWWSLTPRVAYGYANAIDQQIKGQMLSATLTNAFFLDHIGRGSLTLATLVGYSRVMQMDYLDLPIATRTSNYAFRNGLAYEYPLGERLFGRRASLRTSYAFTVYGGDDLYGRWMHEFTASLGVRRRGSDVRNRFETFRVGLIGRVARNANSEHLFVGVRF